MLVFLALINYKQLLKKIRRIQRLELKPSEETGIEPVTAVLKTAVLPLNYSSLNVQWIQGMFIVGSKNTQLYLTKRHSVAFF